MFSHSVMFKSLCLQIPLSIGFFSSVQFSCSVMSNFLSPQGLHHVRLPCPITNSWSLFKLVSIESVMPSNHLLLCRPLLILLPSIFPSIKVFSNESVLCIRWPKYSSFQILGGKILKPFEVLEFTTQLYVVSCFNIPHILIFLLTHGGIGKVNPSWYFIQRLCSFVSLSTWILWEVPCQIVNRKKERYC